jgi:hypothetical protein
MYTQDLEDFGLDAPRHNRKILRLAPDGVPDKLPRGKELARLNARCDAFLRSRGIHQTTSKEWLYPHPPKKGQKKKLTKFEKTQLIEADYERDRSR